MMPAFVRSGTRLHMNLARYICAACCLTHTHPVRYILLFFPSTVFHHQVSILKRADLSASDISQLADAVEPITFADGEL